ncbi:hypothetical protein ACGF0D_39355 [Kitasatospora sp. NPDC048298]|uniref:hypothetical protein n=1 Tax=Kitasatospora sp. NPDC048298 TaxID=3364049 RepID=UPI0037233159
MNPSVPSTIAGTPVDTAGVLAAVHVSSGGLALGVPPGADRGEADRRAAAA